jgi:hypothetical protein
MSTRTLVVGVPALLAFFLLPEPAASRTWHILPDGTGDAPTIQAGIDSAAAGDIVEVACGDYFEWDINVKPDIVLRSESGSPECVTIDAERQGAVLLCTAHGTTLVEGLTLIHGLAFCPIPEGVSNNGGGLHCSLGDVIVHNCVFRDNEATGSGGGMFCGTSSEGGIVGPSSAVVMDCLFVDNHAAGGGGFHAGLLGTVELTGCIMTGNTANAHGGGVLASECALTMTSCTLYGNSAPYGGGLSCIMASPLVQNCIIAYNFQGVAVYCEQESSPVLDCCDLYGNEGGDWVACIAEQVEGSGNFSADPCFCDAGGGDFHLCADSWCLAGHHPWGCDDLVGAFGQGCDACDCSGTVAVEPATLGAVKAMYR